MNVVRPKRWEPWTDPIDSPVAYDQAEQHALLDLPNRVIEASRAIAFHAVGYPTHISDIRMLWRYADVMQEHRAKLSFDQLGGLTAREFELIQAITKRVEALTDKLCNHCVTPGAGLIRAIAVYREIKKLYPDGASIFELGAGSGYIGALLLEDGYTYHTSDITQAFALWQINLLGEQAVIPWWEWMTSAGPKVDVFTANHMLNEMHPNALVYTAKQARVMLQDKGVFLVENFGAKMRGDADTWATLNAHGIKPALIADLRTSGITVQWGDLVQWWQTECGGIPQSADETFLEALT